MSRGSKYSPEVRERAVRMVLEHQDTHSSQWAAIESIAGKIGCTSESLRNWVRRAERDQARKARVPVRAHPCACGQAPHAVGDDDHLFAFEFLLLVPRDDGVNELSQAF